MDMSAKVFCPNPFFNGHNICTCLRFFKTPEMDDLKRKKSSCERKKTIYFCFRGASLKKIDNWIERTCRLSSDPRPDKKSPCSLLFYKYFFRTCTQIWETIQKNVFFCKKGLQGRQSIFATFLAERWVDPPLIGDKSNIKVYFFYALPYHFPMPFAACNILRGVLQF